MFLSPVGLRSPGYGIFSHNWEKIKCIFAFMKDYRRRLAQYLRTSRGKESLAAFGRRIGVSESTLHRLEMAEQNVGLDALDTICTRLKCEIGDLFPPLNRQD